MGFSSFSQAPHGHCVIDSCCCCLLHAEPCFPTSNEQSNRSIFPAITHVHFTFISLTYPIISYPPLPPTPPYKAVCESSASPKNTGRHTHRRTPLRPTWLTARDKQNDEKKRVRIAEGTVHPLWLTGPADSFPRQPSFPVVPDNEPRRREPSEQQAKRGTENAPEGRAHEGQRHSREVLGGLENAPPAGAIALRDTLDASSNVRGG